MRIHQLLSGAGPHDAITSEAVSFRARFHEWGWDGKDYAAHVAPGLNGHIRMLKRFKPKPDDVLLIHHSAGAPRLRELLALPNRKLMLYHNVTPAPWFWEHAPNVAVQCAVGREQLPALVRSVQLAAADSAFNAAELEALGAARTAVIPLLVDYTRLGPPRAESTTPPGPPTVLFVGRLSPHKHQDQVIRAFSLYRRHRAPDARLVLVGDPISSRYLAFLRNLADALAPGAVSIESGLSNEELGERYRAAHVFLCLSAHEGFCIPVLEALSQGVPVIARPAGAIPETTGDAAILVDDPDLAVIAELVHLAVTDAELRAELRRRGRARLALHSPDRIAQRLREAVEAASRG
ncbi:MAG TPA: glycosyltransferase [Solirubrobacteraceae bacterium]|jgi:glycosyltransferase involved in cell wall biosynthesis|nr:glycosyltransferase [Solirubrobacteraceae bacterium]